ncbi:MAG: PSD1 and planctomycete cytochrome C domain-containing protein [Acidobacteriota bacterium]|nr:PSD1 and planctomycete cytochrome C domain-containing protein [Acidobacteriota bacterium]
MKLPARFSSALLALPLCATAFAQASAHSREQIEYFEKNVRPVLVKNCQGCHNSKLKSASLDLSSAAGFMAGSQSGPIVLKDQPESSRLLKVIGYEDSPKMPPTGKLKPEEIADLTAWVKMGAPWPGADQAAAILPPAPAKKEFTPEQKAFWAFQPVKDYAPPKVADAKWARTPVDRFILAKLEEKGLKPAPPADKMTLLRRATFDLTGLPPTEQEIGSFLADQSPRAFEKVVDRLLASPRYGERWGRHWLDVSRYADSTGNDEDHRYPYAWRYRDYVIQSFNDDLPYNQFVREQVAGDLLPSKDFNARGIVATGFLALGQKALAQVDKTKMLYDVYDEQVDVTSKAILGLTMACARCHDHKFDPILTKDYYSMVGIFANTKDFKNAKVGVAQLLYRPLVPQPEYDKYLASQAEIGLKKLAIEEVADVELAAHSKQMASNVADYMLAARQVYVDHADAADFASRKHLDEPTLGKWVKLLKPSPESRPYLDEWHAATFDTLPATAQAYQKRFQDGLEEFGKALAKARDGERKKLDATETVNLDKPKLEGNKDAFFNAVENGPFKVADKEREKLFSAEARERVAQMKAKVEELKKSGVPEPDMADAVTEGDPVEQKVLLRGDYHNGGEDAPKSVPAILMKAAPAPEHFTGSGRLELADWFTRPDNPLTARVMVNRIWLGHFGEGIVATPDNFGRMGARPTHPELLDYLSKRFIEGGWSVKKMHRMMMLSNAYQMSTEGDAKSYEKDPEDNLISRFQRQRLDVEEIRDGMLAIDGTLDCTMGGTLQTGFGTDSENSEGRLSMNPAKIKRRTVYLPLRRANLPTLLNLFDFGDATTETGKRSLTNVAPQALFMMNSEFVFERSKNVAQSLLADSKLSDKRRLEELYVRTLNRRPAPAEMDSAFTYMEKFKQKFHAPDLEAWESFSHILLTSNEFVYLD